MAKESTIQHYTSSTTGNTPSAVDLASGELAINIADEKVFLKNLLGNVVSLSQSKDLSGAFASKATVVTSFNGLTGAVSYSPAFASSSVTGVASFNSTYFAVGATGVVTLASAYQVTGQTVVGGTGISVSKSGNTSTVTNIGVQSIDGATGAIVNIAKTDVNNNFTAGQTINGSLSSYDGGVEHQITLSPSTDKIIFLNDANGNTLDLYAGDNFGNQVISFPTSTTTLAGIGVSQTFTATNTFNALQNFTFGISASGATFSGNISAPNIVTSFNGATGAVGYSPAFASSSVTGVASFNSTYFTVGGNGAVTLASAYQVTGDTVAGGTGISVSRSGNTSTVTNTGVQSFNGATGAVTGATLGANTFTALNSFNAGISASGATFSGLISGATATFSKDITVNSMTVGRGGGDVSSNVAIGFECLGTNTTGTDSVAVGYRALRQNTTGIRNVGVGQNALGQNTDGSYKTAIGYFAGRYAGTATTNLSTGTGGIYIGYQSRGSALAQTNEIVIGVDALGLGSNTAVIGATTQSAATVYGVLNLPSGLSAAGATFSGSIISTGYQISSGAINAQTGSYSLVAGDNGKIVTMNVASANNLTVPASLAVGFNCTVIQLGAGQTTILASGTTLNSYQGYLKISGQHGSASIVGYTSNVYNVAGNLSA